MVNLQKQGLVALQDLSKQNILDILAHAKQFKKWLTQEYT